MRNDKSRVIRGQHVTEKASRLLPESQYVFKVDRKANKFLIKKVIEEKFKVKVQAINMAVMGGKTRRFGKIMGKRSDWKKAYVILQKGYSLDLESNSSTVKG